MPDDERGLLSSWPLELCFLLELPCRAESMNLFRFLFPPPHCIVKLLQVGVTAETCFVRCEAGALIQAPFMMRCSKI